MAVGKNYGHRLFHIRKQRTGRIYKFFYITTLFVFKFKYYLNCDRNNNDKDYAPKLVFKNIYQWGACFYFFTENHASYNRKITQIIYNPFDVITFLL